jgi:hypothetical protein
MENSILIPANGAAAQDQRTLSRFAAMRLTAESAEYDDCDCDCDAGDIDNY